MAAPACESHYFSIIFKNNNYSSCLSVRTPSRVESSTDNNAIMPPVFILPLLFLFFHPHKEFLVKFFRYSRCMCIYIYIFPAASDVASYLFLCRNSHYRGRDATSRKRKRGGKKNAQTEERSRNQVICAPKQEFLVKLSIRFPCFLVKHSVFLSCRFTGDL